MIDLGLGVLTVPAGNAQLLLGDLPSRRDHAAFIASMADDPDLATTRAAFVLDDHLLRDVLAGEQDREVWPTSTQLHTRKSSKR